MTYKERILIEATISKCFDSKSKLKKKGMRNFFICFHEEDCFIKDGEVYIDNVFTAGNPQVFSEYCEFISAQGGYPGRLFFEDKTKESSFILGAYQSDSKTIKSLSDEFVELYVSRCKFLIDARSGEGVYLALTSEGDLMDSFKTDGKMTFVEFYDMVISSWREG